MDDLSTLIWNWVHANRAFARHDLYRWGSVVGDARYPDLIVPNSALVGAVRPVSVDEVMSAFDLAAPHAVRRSVTIIFPDEQYDLVAGLHVTGGSLYFDRVFAAGPTPDVDTSRVEEIADPDADEAFRRAHRTTSAIFGIHLPDEVEQLERVDREVLRPTGRRWFAVRGDDGGIEAVAALDIGPAGEIDHVATLPAARGRGHATALVARCVAEARAAGRGSVLLMAEPDGQGERIYRRLGFRPLGDIAGWSCPRVPAGTTDQPTNL